MHVRQSTRGHLSMSDSRRSRLHNNHHPSRRNRFGPDHSIRMPCCPFRSPFKASRRFPGGISKSVNWAALFEHSQLPPCKDLQLPWVPPHLETVPYAPCILRSKGTNHVAILSRVNTIVKRSWGTGPRGPDSEAPGSGGCPSFHGGDPPPHKGGIVAAYLADSSVLLDVLTVDPAWAEWSVKCLEEALAEGSVFIDPIAYAEITIATPRCRVSSSSPATRGASGLTILPCDFRVRRSAEAGAPPRNGRRIEFSAETRHILKEQPFSKR